MTNVSRWGGSEPSTCSGISRRAAVALGLLGLTSGVAGCGNAAVNSSGFLAATEGNGDARKDFASARDKAEESWSALQDSIASAQEADKEFRAGVVKNPDDLTAFEAALADASAVEDAHSDYADESKTSEKLAKATKKLKAAAATYDAAAQKLSDAQGMVELRKPGEGSFTYTDWDGYTYRIDYNLNPEITVDTTEGKPGQVGLYFDFSGCSVTLTNTTPGKKAPGMALTLNPLYSVDDFSDFIDEYDMEFGVATLGPLSQPASFDAAPTQDEIGSLTYECRYLNPFDNDPRRINPAYGEVSRMDFSACATHVSYGTTMYDEGDDLEVGETRELMCVFMSSALTGGKQKWSVGNISENHVDKFRKIVGWAIHPESGTYAPNDEAVFAGNSKPGTMFAHGTWLYGYNPVTG